MRPLIIAGDWALYATGVAAITVLVYYALAVKWERQPVGRNTMLFCLMNAVSFGYLAYATIRLRLMGVYTLLPNGQAWFRLFMFVAFFLALVDRMRLVWLGRRQQKRIRLAKQAAGEEF